jgi:hypothetical protein
MFGVYWTHTGPLGGWAAGILGSIVNLHPP